MASSTFQIKSGKHDKMENSLGVFSHEQALTFYNINDNNILGSLVLLVIIYSKFDINLQLITKCLCTVVCAWMNYLFIFNRDGHL